MPYRRNGAGGFNHPHGKHPRTSAGGRPGDLSAPPQPSERGAPAGPGGHSTRSDTMQAWDPRVDPTVPSGSRRPRSQRVVLPLTAKGLQRFLQETRVCTVHPCRGQCTGQPRPTGPASRPRTRAGARETRPHPPLAPLEPGARVCPLVCKMMRVM